MSEVIVVLGPAGWERRTVERTVRLRKEFQVIGAISWSRAAALLPTKSNPVCLLKLAGYRREDAPTGIGHVPAEPLCPQLLVETEAASNAWLTQELGGGAAAVLTWPVSVEQIQQALGLAGLKAAILSPRVAGLLLRRLQSAPLAGSEWGRLTRSELRIASLLASARTNKQIADELKLSTSTVETHLTHIYHKLAVQSRSEAMVKLAIPGTG